MRRKLLRTLPPSMLEWCGGAFDPYAFDLDAVNADLAQIRL